MKKMTKFLTAAIAGIMSAALSNMPVRAEEMATPDVATIKNDATDMKDSAIKTKKDAKAMKKAHRKKMKEAHGCNGKHSCKGHDGCKGMKDAHSCKGKDGCKGINDAHSCKGKDGCKGMKETTPAGEVPAASVAPTEGK